jgi:hypothetical protein
LNKDSERDCQAMNIFGSFTFGGLIKTLLPGFVWLIAIVVIETAVSQLVGHQSAALSFYNSSPEAALVLAVPISILMGLWSNTIVFMGVNDRLIREPAKRKNPELFKLYDLLAKQIRDQCWDFVECTDAEVRKEFDLHTDVELIMLRTLGVDKLAYVREQYWYHLEFQMNMILSISALFVSLSLYYWASVEPLCTALGYMAFCLAILASICGLLYAAARKNYLRHISKMLSLMASMVCPKPQLDEGN